MAGILYGVGVGPGDPELVTLKALRVMRECPILAAPASGGQPGVAYQIACAADPSLKEKSCVILELPMTRDEDKLKESRKEAALLLVSYLEKGQDVAVLTLGDPSVYSTYSYLQDLICEMGYEARMIPGVPSFCAAAASAGKSLTQAGEPLRILPGSYSCAEEELAGCGTRVLMKTGKQTERVKKLLKDRGLLEQALLVENCGMPGERIRPFRDVEQSGYFSVILV